LASSGGGEAGASRALRAERSNASQTVVSPLANGRVRDLALQALPLSLVLAAAAFMVERDGGFSPVVWYPVALLILGLCVAMLLGAGRLIGDLRRPAIAAITCLGLFTAWSFATTDWAADRGAAWEGSNRDLLYLLVFALLATWPACARAVWPVILGACLIVTAEGVATVEQAVHSADIGNFLIGSRLSEPLGNPNATAALFMLCAWLMVGLATRPWIPASARGLAFGLAGLDLTLNLLTESRGSIFTLPLVGLLYFILVPCRLRSVAALGVIALACAPVIEPVLHVYSAAPSAVAASMNRALGLGLAWAAILALAGWLFAWFDDRVSPPLRVIRSAAAAVWVGLVLGTAAIALLLKPWQHVDSAWRSFRHGGEPSGAASHFGGLGSNRYDFWRVGLVEFKKHAFGGIGTDNFLVPYLQLGRSTEQPIYPHSLLIDLLSETGLVGTAFFLAFLVLTVVVVLRMPSGRERDLACLLVVGASVWLVHGLVDWLWEMPALGVLGMALLGTACGLGLRQRRSARRGSRVARVALPVAGLVTAVILAASLTLPWLADRDVRLAESVWVRSPSTAFALLQHAHTLNPLDDQADVVAGAVASRLHRYGLMRIEFQQAVERSPEDWYANLELGIAASLTGKRGLAGSSLRRAAHLNPRDPIPRSVLLTFDTGRRIDPAAVDSAFEARG
jgi:hypothetical protein